MKERRIGIVGGMGPMAGVKLQEEIYRLDEVSSDQEHVVSVVVNDTKVPDRTDFLLGRSEESPLPRIVADVRMLEEMGASVIAIPCNTSMSFIGEIREAVSVPVLDIVWETVTEVKGRGISKVLFLVTDGLRKVGLYQKYAEEMGVEYGLPDEEGQKTVMGVIYGIKAGEEVDVSGLLRVIEESGCDGVVLGCTELSLVGDKISGVTVIDSVEVLARRAIEEVRKDG